YPDCATLAEAAAEAVAASRRRLEPTRIHEAAAPHQPASPQETATARVASPLAGVPGERPAGAGRSRKWAVAAGVVLAVVLAALLVAIPFSSSDSKDSNDSSTVAINSTTLL